MSDRSRSELAADTGERIRSVWSRAQKVITPAGWGAISLAAGSYVVGIWLDWRELIVIASGTVLLLVVSLLWLAGSLGLDVERRLPRSRVTVGERVVAELRVRNPHRRPMGRRIGFDRFGERVVIVRIPALTPHAEHVERSVVPTERRGVLTIGPLHLQRGDPFGFFRRERSAVAAETLSVVPRVHPLRLPSASWTSDLDGRTHDRSPSGGTSFHTLRQYQRGDDVRHIHWRSSARMQDLMVRQFVDTRRPATLLALDARRTAYRTEDDFEVAVEFAASVAMSAVRTGRPVTALSLGVDLGGRLASTLDEELVVRFAALTTIDDESLASLEQLVRATRTRATETVLVTGPRSEGVAALMQHAPSGYRLVVHVGAGAAPPGSGHKLRAIHGRDIDELLGRWTLAIR